MNNEENYIMRISPSIESVSPWKCQICERIGNETNIIFTLDPSHEICNDCWLDCKDCEDIE